MTAAAAVVAAVVDGRRGVVGVGADEDEAVHAVAPVSVSASRGEEEQLLEQGVDADDEVEGGARGDVVDEQGGLGDLHGLRDVRAAPEVPERQLEGVEDVWLRVEGHAVVVPALGFEDFGGRGGAARVRVRVRVWGGEGVVAELG